MQRQAPPVFASVARRPAVVISSSATRLSPIHPRSKGTKYDLVLSSGFLAFANHCGFLQAVDDVGLPVNGIMGTSAGALIGSLYAAGWSPRDIVAEFAKLTPIQRLSYHDRPWEGMLSMEKLIGELESLLPRSFADLKRDFACAVVCANGQHVLLDRGQLAAAVSASAAIPMIFRPVTLPDRHDGPFIDGGIRCRIGLDLWRQHRYGGDSDAHPAVVHLIGRSSPFSGNDSTAGLANQNAVVVQSPKSGVTFWSYGDYEHQFEAARQRALPVLLALLDTEGEGNSSAGANNGANNAVPAGTAGSSSLTAAGRQAASAAGSNSI